MQITSDCPAPVERLIPFGSSFWVQSALAIMHSLAHAPGSFVKLQRTQQDTLAIRV